MIILSKTYLFALDKSSLSQIIHPKCNCSEEKKPLNLIKKEINRSKKKQTLTVDLLLHRRIRMEDAKRMYKLFKFNNTIFLLIKNIENLNEWLFMNILSTNSDEYPMELSMFLTYSI